MLTYGFLFLMDIPPVEFELKNRGNIIALLDVFEDRRIASANPFELLHGQTVSLSVIREVTNNMLFILIKMFHYGTSRRHKD